MEAHEAVTGHEPTQKDEKTMVRLTDANIAEKEKRKKKKKKNGGTSNASRRPGALSKKRGTGFEGESSAEGL
jgi:hypothetical protein